MRLMTLATCSLLSLSTLLMSSNLLADWSLQQPSSIHFLTNKNTHITEVHSFKKFDSNIADSGYVTLNIDLTSVDTRIAIRDERMQEHLFESKRFSQAKFEAEIPVTVLAQVSAGNTAEFDLTGTVSLHGEQAKANCKVIISPNKDKTVTVTSITPMVIDAESFNLVAGINKLKEIAGLKSITRAVPLTFSLTYKENP